MMRQSLNRVLIVLVLACMAQAGSPLQCIQYLNELKTLAQQDPQQFVNVMAVYALYSGKDIDDLGFPTLCRQQSSLIYTTVEFSVVSTIAGTTQLPGVAFYGLCFSNLCPAADLNQNANFIVQWLLRHKQAVLNSIAFVEPGLTKKSTLTAVIVVGIVLIWIAVLMAYAIKGYISKCRTTPQIQTVPETEDTTEITLLRKISLAHRWNALWEQEQSLKVVEVSYLRIIALPLIIYSQTFYASNSGAINIFSFSTEIYEAFFAKVALFGYYIPDIFFMISGFFMARRIFELDEYEENKLTAMLRCARHKILRLYPNYALTIIIYWLVTPTLHAGPVWYVYQGAAYQCSPNVWRSLLLIDNWWANGNCGSPLWFVEVQIQLLLLSCLFYALFFQNRSIAISILAFGFFASLFACIFFGAQLPISRAITISEQSRLYFTSLYGHLPFHLLGILIAFILHKESVKSSLSRLLSGSNQPVDIGGSNQKKSSASTIMILAASVLIFVIMLRPSVWHQGQSLRIELGLCRLGAVLSVLLLLLPGLLNKTLHKTVVHKLAHHIYSMLLWTPVVVFSWFWSSEEFPYVNLSNMVNSTLSSLAIVAPLGLIMGIATDIPHK